MKKVVFSIIVLFLININFAFADIYSEDNLYGQPVTNITHITIYNLNSSDFWDSLNTPSDIDGSLYNWINFWNRSGTNVFLHHLGDNVGIGTASPNDYLHILTTNTGNQDMLSLEAAYEAEHLGPALKFIRAGSVLARIRGIEEGGWDGGLTFEVFEVNGGSIGRDGATTEAMRIDQYGNVGIGTASPNYPLTFAASTGSKINLFAGQNWGMGIQAQLIQFITHSSAGDFTFGYGISDALTRIMTIEGTGNVGIGTVSPTHELNVVGDLNVTGTIINDAIYAQLSDLNDQTFASADVGQAINLTTTDEINGLSVSESNVTISIAGVYSIFAQPQVTAGAGDAGNFHMWLEKYNTTQWLNVSNSNVELTLDSLDEDVIPLIVVIKLNANEKIRVMGSVSDTGIKLDTQDPATEPTIPSIIFTMYRVGN